MSYPHLKAGFWTHPPVDSCDDKFFDAARWQFPKVQRGQLGLALKRVYSWYVAGVLYRDSWELFQPSIPTLFRAYIGISHRRTHVGIGVHPTIPWFPKVLGSFGKIAEFDNIVVFKPARIHGTGIFTYIWLIFVVNEKVNIPIQRFLWEIGWKHTTQGFVLH